MPQPSAAAVGARAVRGALLRSRCRRGCPAVGAPHGYPAVGAPSRIPRHGCPAVGAPHQQLQQRQRPPRSCPAPAAAGGDGRHCAGSSMRRAAHGMGGFFPAPSRAWTHQPAQRTSGMRLKFYFAGAGLPPPPPAGATATAPTPFLVEVWRRNTLPYPAPAPALLPPGAPELSLGRDAQVAGPGGARAGSPPYSPAPQAHGQQQQQQPGPAAADPAGRGATPRIHEREGSLPCPSFLRRGWEIVTLPIPPPLGTRQGEGGEGKRGKKNK